MSDFVQLTPEEEGVFLAQQGVSLSNLWGEVSHVNFVAHYGEVLESYMRESERMQSCQLGEQGDDK